MRTNGQTHGMAKSTQLSTLIIRLSGSYKLIVTIFVTNLICSIRGINIHSICPASNLRIKWIFRAHLSCELSYESQHLGESKICIDSLVLLYMSFGQKGSVSPKVILWLYDTIIKRIIFVRWKALKKPKSVQRAALISMCTSFCQQIFDSIYTMYIGQLG